MEIAGIDTISGLAGDPPKIIKLPKDVIRIADKLREVWNNSHLAFIPYCFKCKEPVNWVQPTEDGVVFRCPKCKRVWIVE